MRAASIDNTMEARNEVMYANLVACLEGGLRGVVYSVGLSRLDGLLCHFAENGYLEDIMVLYPHSSEIQQEHLMTLETPQFDNWCKVYENAFSFYEMTIGTYDQKQNFLSSLENILNPDVIEYEEVIISGQSTTAYLSQILGVDFQAKQRLNNSRVDACFERQAHRPEQAEAVVAFLKAHHIVFKRNDDYIVIPDVNDKEVAPSISDLKSDL